MLKCLCGYNGGSGGGGVDKVSVTPSADLPLFLTRENTGFPFWLHVCLSTCQLFAIIICEVHKVDQRAGAT